ncbi:Putative Auxin efflux transporter family protein (Eurofung) [Aspergillus calidoustus]|uniref:Putative Auxin efflux transporter family protein (Eurofung) n=1 Tax=Aspergillus calidoustus TaxID=454130 RepID=A0A0U5CRH0_ASPCI|nr:Putative Auxin efflux transporter family protein (Eurofung) [Aspergillus calidoustus]
MAFFTAPRSFQSTQFLAARQFVTQSAEGLSPGILQNVPNSHNSHPPFLQLVLLVFEAVLEVVCVSLPGYIAARVGMFDADAQKFVANLNVTLFTPCLIFIKLGSQLTAEKLTDLAIIPAIFIVQTAVSYFCAFVVSRCFRFQKRPANFVAAMAVFGNSNSLPISLVVSLSQTLRGLHWDRIPNDNDDEVAARGILYLLIFQQLGQLVRWSWGYRVLLAPREQYLEEVDPDEPLIRTRSSSDGSIERPNLSHDGSEDFHSGEATPVNTRTYSYAKLPHPEHEPDLDQSPLLGPPPSGPFLPRQDSRGDILRFPNVEINHQPDSSEKGPVARLKAAVGRLRTRVANGCVQGTNAVYDRLPPAVQRMLSASSNLCTRFFGGLWDFMNPPLWAMLVAIIVASVPSLQHLFFDEGTFVQNSVTRAINQNGQVAVPLILVVLGANLERNTIPQEALEDMEDAGEEKKLIIASLVARMFLPTVIMAPLLALLAKYVPVSIVDDPIFIIVCFLLTGAPSALQLAQICQINNVYVGAMSKLLFQSYVDPSVDPHSCYVRPRGR